MRRPRLSTLAAGLSLIVFGTWILLDAEGSVHVTFAALGPALAAAAGLLLLASGLEERR